MPFDVTQYLETVSFEQAVDLYYSLSPYDYLVRIGLTPFPWQEYILKSLSARMVINGARQSGKSTIVSGLPTHQAKYFPGTLSIIIAATEIQAREDMLKCKGYMAMDKEYPSKMQNSQTVIHVMNGSRIIVVPATETSARGFSQLLTGGPRLIVVDEASRIPDEVFKSCIVPMLVSNPLCRLIVISTPHGQDGYFHELWTEKNRFQKIEICTPYHYQGGGLVYTPEVKSKVRRSSSNAEDAKSPVKRFISPRHDNKDEADDFLKTMGPRLYQQEMEVKFMAAQDAIFSSEDLARVRQVTPENFERIRQAEALEI